MDYSMRVNGNELEIEVRGNEKDKVTTIFYAAYQLAKMDAKDLKAMELLFDEMVKAKAKHPDFPADIQAGLAIVTEEFLEAVRAVNDREPMECVRQELAHTAVTCIRSISGGWKS